MVIRYRISIVVIITTLLFSCGSTEYVSNHVITENQCDECKVIPKSGSNKDLKYGYYYDPIEKKCKLIRYSTGHGCIPPPFRTLEECVSRCESGNN